MTINVNDMDEAPVITGTSPVEFPENATGTVENFTAKDPEELTTFIWSLWVLTSVPSPSLAETSRLSRHRTTKARKSIA